MCLFIIKLFTCTDSVAVEGYKVVTEVAIEMGFPYIPTI